MGGTVPAGKMAKVPIGARQIQVVADDYEPWTRWIIVKTGETTTVAVRQVEVPSGPFYQTWWFWSVAAAGVAGTVAAAVALSGGGADPTGGGPPAGQTGVNVSVNADDAITGGR